MGWKTLQAVRYRESQLDRCFEEYRQDPDKVVTWEEQGFFPVGVNGGCPSFFKENGIFKRPTTGLKRTVEGESSFSYRM